MAEGKPFPLRYPPGIFRNGTEYQARGRWYDANLVRFLEKTVRPIGGWENLQASGADIDFDVTETLTLTANPADGETVVIAGKTYTFKDILTNTDGYVKTGASTALSLTNLAAAINLSSGGFAGTGGWTDFSEYTAAAVKPADWTTIVGGTDWRVQTDAGATGGQSLQHTAFNPRDRLGWDASNHPTDTEQDVIARLQVAAGGTEDDFGVMLRDDDTGDLINASIDDDADDITIRYALDAIGTYSVTIDADTYYWIRVHVAGTALKMKVWTGVQSDEPASWQIEVTHAVDVDAGHIGVQAGWNKIGKVDVFAFATGGATIPTSTVRYAAATTAVPGGGVAAQLNDTRTYTVAGGATLVETLENGAWSTAILVDNTPRAMIGWRNDAAVAPQLAIGTSSRLYHFTQGALVDRTPAGLTVGAKDSTFGVGAYGSAAYSAGAYGTGDPAQGSYIGAATWTLDTWGDYLVGVLTSDGKLSACTA